jgi:hypothetical protein
VELALNNQADSPPAGVADLLSCESHEALRADRWLSPNSKEYRKTQKYQQAEFEDCD